MVELTLKLQVVDKGHIEGILNLILEKIQDGHETLILNGEGVHAEFTVRNM